MARRIGFQGGDAPAADTSGWDSILDRDERILWQGRPDGAIVFRTQSAFTLIFGLFFAGFALFWMVMASTAGGYFWMFGLLHFSVGIAVAFGGFLSDAWWRRHSIYSLSNKRAFIATDAPVFGRKLKSYPITAETILETDGAPLATIHFATETRRSHSKNGPRYRQVRVGFQRIADGDEVFALLRKVQRGMA